MRLDKGTTQEKVILDRFEGDKVVLLCDNKEELILPKSILPKEVEEGDALVVTVATDEAETERREKTAKELLNEILKIDNE